MNPQGHTTKRSDQDAGFTQYVWFEHNPLSNVNLKTWHQFFNYFEVTYFSNMTNALMVEKYPSKTAFYEGPREMFNFTGLKWNKHVMMNAEMK